MNTEKITGEELYTVEASKINGNTLDADEWNAVSNAAKLSHEKINSIIDDIEDVNDHFESLPQVISVPANGNTAIDSNKDIVLQAKNSSNKIEFKYGTNSLPKTLATFSKQSTYVDSLAYKLNADSYLYAVNENGGVTGSTTIQDIVDNVQLLKEEGELVSAGGANVPRRYDITSVVLNDIDEDSDVVISDQASVGIIPQEGEYLLYTVAKIAGLFDVLESDEIENIQDMLVNGNTVTITYGTTNPASFKIKKSKQGMLGNEVTMDDITKLVYYFKSHNQGPWAE